MTPLNFLLPIAVLAASGAAQQNWRRYIQPTQLSAEFPGEPERFDKWTKVVQGRVTQLTYTGRSASGDFRARYFLQTVIADKPYDVEARIAGDIAEAGGEAAAIKKRISQRSLKASEMPLPGMRGTEIGYRYKGFGADGPWIEVERNMYVGNKWLVVSVRHFENDKSWPRNRFFNSVKWAP